VEQETEIGLSSRSVFSVHFK